MTPHNVPIVCLGLTLLWLGWSGITWVLIEWLALGTPTTVGTATGAVAGLAAVTPAYGFISPISAIFIGIISACVFFVAVVKQKLSYDDSLDVFAVKAFSIFRNLESRWYSF